MKRRILFFDTETTGLPKDYKAPYTNLDNWPRIVQLAWIVTDEYGSAVLGHNRIIRPDASYTIPENMIHGISQEHALEYGISAKEALSEFVNQLKACDLIVCHNFAFDSMIAGADIYRRLDGHSSEIIFEKPHICTMEESVGFCQLPGKFGKKYKWPRLSELHQKLFQKDFSGAHDAMSDVKATKDCFFELVRLEIIPSF